jgi:ribose-phosphate pyrophosphokinase
MITLNGHDVFYTYPNGETGLAHDKVSFHCSVIYNSIHLKYEDDGDIFKLVLLKDFLDTLGVFCKLVMPYVPYSRMDRVEGGSAFTLKGFCRLINNLDFPSVEICEPHSEVVLALLDRVSVTYLTDYLFNVASGFYGFRPAIDKVFLPDAGAIKRYGHSYNPKMTAIGNKVRDFATGNIVSYDVLTPIPKSAVVYIIDDLCSKGGTFVLCTEALIKAGAAHCVLITAHCEPVVSEGMIPNCDKITKMFTTDTMLTEPLNIPKIQVYKFNDIYKKGGPNYGNDANRIV